MRFWASWAGGLRQVPNIGRFEINQGIHCRPAPTIIWENGFDKILFQAECDIPLVGGLCFFAGSFFPNTIDGGGGTIPGKTITGVKEEVDGEDEVLIQSGHAVLGNRILRACHQGFVTAYGEREVGLSLLEGKLVHTAAGKQRKQP